MKLQKVFVCEYCLPVDIRKDVLPCEMIVYGNMPEPSFCPFTGSKCDFNFLNYRSP
jgi:hypothetical protein